MEGQILLATRPPCCHSERSEESFCGGPRHMQDHGEILRFAQNDPRSGAGVRQTDGACVGRASASLVRMQGDHHLNLTG